ncbi:RES domain-containing protein [Rugamonas sp. FT82W]|uniref:RES domain-containing protein n=1 Tax=Duganella vulcania TaxID=2692166 RepID=A0A845G505_9BURK|nr:RES family NAD+ phosphorylase [Duganella vulcania]MYM88552.1 RES domain-containing protein [Duganella vulcania]
MTVSLWRIASDTTSWTAEDMAGKGAASSGSRWNHAGEHVTYAATSISLAAWETRAHFAKGMVLPWNRILVRIDVPDGVWRARELTPRPLPIGWNVVPEGMVSRSIGSAWLASGASALLVVPSVIINEEDNVLINPAHADAASITVARVRQFVYDHRV